MKPYNETALLRRRNELRTKINLILFFPDDYYGIDNDRYLLFFFKRLLNVNKIYHSWNKLKK